MTRSCIRFCYYDCGLKTLNSLQNNGGKQVACPKWVGIDITEQIKLKKEEVRTTQI